MGRDRLWTGGRHPTDASSEGFIVMQLLEKLLEKDPTERVMLGKMKVSVSAITD